MGQGGTGRDWAWQDSVGWKGHVGASDEGRAGGMGRTVSGERLGLTRASGAGGTG